MGLLSSLGKIGKFALKAAPYVAAPFTGGGSLALAPVTSKIGDAIGSVGDVMGAGASAAKQGRMDEAFLQSRMNEGNNRASLDAAGFNANREGQLMRRAIASRMLGGMSGPSDPRDKFGGGAISPDMLEMVSRYGDMADKDVMGGGYKVNPTMSNIPKSGLLEKIGGTMGTASGILDALGKIGGGRPDVASMGGVKMPPMLPEKVGLSAWDARTKLPGFETDELANLSRRA